MVSKNSTKTPRVFTHLLKCMNSSCVKCWWTDWTNSLPTLKHESCSCYKCKLTWNSKNSVISLFLNHFFQTCVQRIWQLSSPKKDIMLCFNLQSNDVQSQFVLGWCCCSSSALTPYVGLHCIIIIYHINQPYMLPSSPPLNLLLRLSRKVHNYTSLGNFIFQILLFHLSSVFFYFFKVKHFNSKWF